MLSFFRRAHASWFVLGLLGLVMVAFVITGVGTPGGLEQLASGGDRIAKVGNQALMATELSSRMQNQLDVARRENPQLDMIGFVRAGGFEQTLEQTISAKALHAFAEAQGSIGPVLFYNTHAAARADAELNGLARGRYRVSFAYTVLSMGPGTLAGNDAAVGYQYGATTVELLGTGSGVYSADIQLNDGSGADDNWIAFFAWSDSHAADGVISGTASLSDASVIRLPDQPLLPTPVPAALYLLGPALGALLGLRRRAA